jgi:phage baseplate assembly protein gpV
MTTKKMGDQGLLWFHGIVESLDDPRKLGRVRIRVTNEHADQSISTDDLPWAYLIMPPNSASMKEVGISPTGIAVGSNAFGFFLDGYEKQIPLIWGTYFKLPDGKNDVSRLALGTNSLKDTQVGPEPPSAYAAKYPYNQVFQSGSGHVVEYDDTPGHERIRIRHKVGSYVEVNEKGRVVVKSVDDAIEVVVKDKTLYTKGNWTVEVNGGQTTIKSQNVTIEGDLHVKGKIDATGDVTAGSISLEKHVHSGVEPGSGSSGPPE